MYEILKPFIYYLYSFTYNIKFVRDHILLMDKISYNYSDEERNNEFDHTLYFYKHGDFLDIESIREFNKNLLKNYDEELVNKNHLLMVLYVNSL